MKITEIINNRSELYRAFEAFNFNVCRLAHESNCSLKVVNVNVIDALKFKQIHQLCSRSLRYNIKLFRSEISTPEKYFRSEGETLPTYFNAVSILVECESFGLIIYDWLMLLTLLKAVFNIKLTTRIKWLKNMSVRVLKSFIIWWIIDFTLSHEIIFNIKSNHHKQFATFKVLGQHLIKNDLGNSMHEI